MASLPFLDGKLVLVVEDESLIALELRAMLDAAGAGRVLVASHLDRAVELLATARPDLVILDILIGKSDAVGFGRQVMALGVPLVVASVIDGHYRLPEPLDRAPFVAKPFTEATLFAGIAAALARFG